MASAPVDWIGDVPVVVPAAVALGCEDLAVGMAADVFYGDSMDYRAKVAAIRG